MELVEQSIQIYEAEQGRSVVAQIRLWHQRYRQRQQLLMLDDNSLKDIGISKADALREARKPFWVK